MRIKEVKGGVCAPEGFKASGIHCGIRKNKAKKDLALIVSDVRAAAAGVYTTNLVKGAPVVVTKANIADGYAQFRRYGNCRKYVRACKSGGGRC